MSLEKILELGKKVSKMEEGKIPIHNHNNPQIISGNINSINDMVYGNNLIIKEGEEKPYDAHEEMKRLKQGLPEDISNCKLPSSILESIKKNPLNNISEDPNMDAFTKKLTNVLPDGIKRFGKIQEKLDAVDKKNKTNEQTGEITSLDYDEIKKIVNECVTNAFNSFSKTLLNEKQEHSVENAPQLKAMKLGSKFLFLDTDDNVYECKLIYKGKNKRRNKN